jgi:hypothetical protein
LIYESKRLRQILNCKGEAILRPNAILERNREKRHSNNAVGPFSRAEY